MTMDFKQELEITEKELQKQVALLQQQQVLVNRLEGIVMYLRGKVASDTVSEESPKEESDQGASV